MTCGGNRKIRQKKSIQNDNRMSKLDEWAYNYTLVSAICGGNRKIKSIQNDNRMSKLDEWAYNYTLASVIDNTSKVEENASAMGWAVSSHSSTDFLSLKSRANLNTLVTLRE